jgi:hypothetical protein
MTKFRRYLMEASRKRKGGSKKRKIMRKRGIAPKGGKPLISGKAKVKLANIVKKLAKKHNKRK